MIAVRAQFWIFHAMIQYRQHMIHYIQNVRCRYFAVQPNLKDILIFLDRNSYKQSQNNMLTMNCTVANFHLILPRKLIFRKTVRIYFFVFVSNWVIFCHQFRVIKLINGCVGNKKIDRQSKFIHEAWSGGF